MANANYEQIIKGMSADARRALENVTGTPKIGSVIGFCSRSTLAELTSDGLVGERAGLTVTDANDRVVGDEPR